METSSPSVHRRRPARYDRFLLVASLSCILLLALHFGRARWGPEYLQHQRVYRADLEKTGPGAVEGQRRYPLQLRQIVLPDDGRIDRCVSCHVGMEDPAMAEADQPLRAHPGAYLQHHEPGTFGCTLCHDGDGRALDRDAAHGRTRGGRPILPMPFLQANCLRCHAPADLPELEIVQRGRSIFAEKDCLVCHELDGEGGRLAPDLTRLGDAHPNQKAPMSFSAEDVATRFGGSLNLAYIYESVLHPELQPGLSFMPEFKFSEDDALALTVFLKSLSERNAPQALQARQWRQHARWELETQESTSETGDLETPEP